MSLVIELPWPDKRLNPNARLHWAQIAKARAEAKAEAMALAFQAMQWCAPLPDVTDASIPLTLEFRFPTNGRRDRDNLLSACKAQLDGIAEVLGVDDARFEPITLRRGPTQKGGQVIVRIGEE